MKIISTLLLFLILLILPMPVFAQSVSGTVSFAPVSASSAVNTDFNVDVKLTLNQTISVQIYSINASFDTSKLELKSITYLVGQSSSNLGADSNTNIAEINSRQAPAVLKLFGESTDQSGFSMTASQSVSVVRLTFAPRNASATTINILNNSTAITVQADSSVLSINLPVASMDINGGPTASPSTAPVAGITTDTVKIVEDNSRNTIDKDDTIWDNPNIVTEKRYQDVVSAKVPFTFRDIVCVTTPCDTFPNGDRLVHVLFIGHDSAGTVYKKVETKSIYVALKPKIDSVSCSISPSGGTSVSINGSHFGNTFGSIRMGSQNAVVTATTWGNLAITTTFTSPLQSNTGTVIVTTPEGQFDSAQCTLGQTQVDFVASLACRSVSKPLTTANIEIKESATAVGIGSTAPAGQPGLSIFKKDGQSFDNNGRPQGILPNLLETKDYNFIIQAPFSLRKVIPFKAKKGTSVLEALDLPLGDIAPERSDCRINSLDVSRLYSEWASNTDVTNRRGDLNQDGRVNSIDYACLRSNFDKRCDDIP